MLAKLYTAVDSEDDFLRGYYVPYINDKCNECYDGDARQQ